MEAILQTYLVPILFLIYAFMLLARPPKPGTNWGFCTQRAQKSEKVWYYAQRVTGLYCGAAGLVLLLVITLLRPVFWLEMILELVLIFGLYPLVTNLLKKTFPDD